MTDPIAFLAAGGATLLLLAALGALGWQLFQRWYVAVQPDEYVVHYRRGVVRSVGRGLSFFCLPGDTYLKVPSTIRDINFAADQITQEKQGVRVQGFLAYKIADFELAYQSLDLKAKSIRVLKECSESVSATDYSEKNCEEVIRLDPDDPLAKTDMVLKRLAESVVRHEVSNKTMDQMITERESVIQSMREQLQATVAHWGIEIDTIEFTEVWIRSAELFQNLQADYRNQTRLSASESTAATDRAIAETRLRSEQEIALLEAESERVRRVRASEEIRQARTTEIATQAQLEELEHQEQTRLEEQRLARKRELDRIAKENEAALAAQALEIAKAEELARIEAHLQKQQETHKLELDRRSKNTELEENRRATERRLDELTKQNQIAAAELQGKLDAVLAELAAAIEKAEAEKRRIQTEAAAEEIERMAAAEKAKIIDLAEALERRGRAEADSIRARTEAENSVEPQQLRRRFIELLPQVAEAMRVKDVRWINLAGGSGGAGGGSPMEMIPEALARSLAVFQGLGVDLEELLARSGGDAEDPAPPSTPPGLPGGAPEDAAA